MSFLKKRIDQLNSQEYKNHEFFEIHRFKYCIISLRTGNYIKRNGRKILPDMCALELYLFAS